MDATDVLPQDLDWRGRTSSMLEVRICTWLHFITLYYFLGASCDLALSFACDVNSMTCFSAGVIDEDYRGNVGVLLFNHSDEKFEVKRGDRVAQLICERIYYPVLKEIEVKMFTEYSFYVALLSYGIKICGITKQKCFFISSTNT